MTKTLRVFMRGNAVVVEQQGVWRAVDSGEVMGDRTLASRFVVDGGCVTHFEGYDSVDDALQDGASVFRRGRHRRLKMPVNSLDRRLAKTRA